MNSLEKIGLQIVAASQVGLMDSFNCDSCTDEMKRIRNCKMENEGPNSIFYLEGVGEFYTCPLLFIPQSVQLFLDEYNYLEKYPSAALSFNDVNPRYWESVKYFEGVKTKMRETTPPEITPEENKSKMAGLFN